MLAIHCHWGSLIVIGGHLLSLGVIGWLMGAVCLVRMADYCFNVDRLIIIQYFSLVIDKNLLIHYVELKRNIKRLFNSTLSATRNSLWAI